MAKKTWMKGFLVTGVVAAALGVYTMTSSITADAQTDFFEMEVGASIRLTEGSTGIRFTGYVDAVDEDANYGVIIAPTAYFMNGDAYVTGDYHTYLEKYNVKEGDVVTDLGYIDLASKPTLVTDDKSEYNGKYAINGSIAKVHYENMNLAFTGIAYKEVDGAYTYADFDKFEDISRSVTNVSSRAMQDKEYETKFKPTQQTIIENFLVDGIAQAAGATKSENTYTYNGQSYDADELMAAINPTLIVTEVNELSLLRKAEVTATFSVVGADLHYGFSATGAVSYADGKAQAINVGDGAITVSVGYKTATTTVNVPEPVDMTTEGYVIADMDNANAISTTIAGFDVSRAEEIYEATGANTYVDLRHADGKLGATLTTGEKQIYALALDGRTYKLAGVASDCVIDNATEFATWYNSTTDKYAVLVNDVTLEGTSKGYQMTAKFSGRTFNGLGYTIYNGYFPLGFFADGRIGTKAELKNVNFENMMIGNAGVFGTYVEGGKIENVNVQAVFQKTYNVIGGWANYLWVENTGKASGTEQTTVKDCTFIFSMPEHMIESQNRLYYDENHYETEMTNVEIYSSAGIAKPGEEALLPNGGAKSMITTNVAKAIFTEVDIYDRGDVPETAKNSYELLTNNQITFDAAAFGLETLPTIAKVYFEGYTLSDDEYTVANDAITVPCTTYGTKMIVIETQDGTRYMTSKAVADHEISSFEDFYSVTYGANRNQKNYSVFTKDVDCTGKTSSEVKWIVNEVVINGRGFALKNFTGDLCVFYNTSGTWGILKNLNIENLTGFTKGALGTDNVGLVVDNVHVTATIPAGYNNGLLCGPANGEHPLRLLNSSLTFTATDENASYKIAQNTHYMTFHTANTTIELTNAEFAVDYDENDINPSGVSHRYGYTVDGTRKTLIYGATLKDTTCKKYWITNEQTGTTIETYNN